MSEAKFSDLLDTYLRDPYAQELASSPSNLPDASSEMSSQCDNRKVSDGGPQPAPPPGIFGDKTISEVDIQHADLVLKCSLFQLPASSRVTLEKPNAPREDHAQEVVYSPVADQHAFEISNRSYNANLQGLAVDESQTMYRNGLVYFSGSQMEEQLRSQPQESRLRRFEHSKDQSKGGLQAVAEALGTEAPSTDTPFFAYQSSPGRTECLVVEQQQPHAPLPKSPEANSSGRDAIPWDEPSRPVANRRAPFDQSRADPPLRDLSSSFALKEYFDFSGTAALDI
ncbi:hypothetical protein B0A49_09964 [Cryomyces minteri]|uniref:Uncharacterized protein n=1 Tax=Cryomyces minteri TaxID=331657 RepID=A0A4U0X1N5_9PEZI|nr:hypothetical protein B0A49_09964 [Cryomyces minteri]